DAGADGGVADEGDVPGADAGHVGDRVVPAAGAGREPQAGGPHSAADRGHGAGRLEEGGIVDAVAGALARHGGDPPFGEFVVGGPGAQGGLEVGLLAGEQAVADLAVGGEPYAVAGAAERPGDGPDHAHPGGPAVDEEPLGGGAAAFLQVVGGEVEGAGQHFEYLVGGDHVVAPPAVLGVERHLLDEAQLVA